MKKIIKIISLLFICCFSINVYAEEVLMCEYANYRSNQDVDGTIYIYLDTSNRKWRVKSINNNNAKVGFNQYDTFDRVFSTAGIGLDIQISKDEFNALKNEGTCPRSAIRTNAGSYNIYFSEYADEVIENHNILLMQAHAADNSYSWTTEADEDTKTQITNILKSGILSLTDDHNVDFEQKCNYQFTKDGYSGNVYIYRATATGDWKVIADKGRGSKQFDKTGQFNYVFSTSSSKDVMITKEDKTKLLAGVCPTGALYNTGSGKDDVYIGTMAQELADKKDNITIDANRASSDFSTQEDYENYYGENASYNPIYDLKSHIGDGFCSDKHVKNAMKVVGTFIFIAKIIIPLIIVGYSVFDLWKGVAGGDEKSLSASAKNLGLRVLIGISVFFIPSILHVILGAIDNYTNMEDDFKICETCLLKPNECDISETIFD